MIGWSARRKQPFDWPAISAARGLADYFAIGPMFPPEPTMPRDNSE